MKRRIISAAEAMIVCMAGLLAVSCDQSRYFAFEDVEYVTGFPASYRLASPEILPVDAIGIQGVNVFDDFILLSCADSSGCLSAFDKDGNPVSKPFLRVGRGPGEVLFRPYMSWLSFSEDRGDTDCGLYDFKGNYLICDIAETLSEGSLCYERLADSLPTSAGARYFMVTDSTLICRKANDYGDGYERCLVGADGKERVNEAMSYLNSVRSADKNILATMFVVNREKGIVAELGSRLNVIHLYSLSGDFHRTVAFGSGLEEIEKAEAMEQDDMNKAYHEAKAFRGFFVGLYLGTTIRELDEGSYAPPELHFFSWDGEPLASISLPVRALFFDIDLEDGQLYVVSSDTEEILRYDVSHIIDSLG